MENLGDFLELEMIASEESMREQYLHIIEKFLTELGLSMKDTVRTSYLSMLTGERD